MGERVPILHTSNISFLLERKVVIETNESKHKPQIRISPKPLEFSEHFLSKSFLEFINLSTLQSFLIETSETKIAKVTNSHLRDNSGVFLILIKLKNCCPVNFRFKKFASPS